MPVKFHGAGVVGVAVGGKDVSEGVAVGGTFVLDGVAVAGTGDSVTMKVAVGEGVVLGVDVLGITVIPGVLVGTFGTHKT